MAHMHSDLKDEKYPGEELPHGAVIAEDDSEHQEYLMLAEEFSGAAVQKLTVSRLGLARL